MILEFGNEKNFYGQAFAFQDQVMLLINENEQNALLLTNDAKIPVDKINGYLFSLYNPNIRTSIQHEPNDKFPEPSGFVGNFFTFLIIVGIILTLATILFPQIFKK